jgi:hypothetical protein
VLACVHVHVRVRVLLLFVWMYAFYALVPRVYSVGGRQADVLAPQSLIMDAGPENDSLRALLQADPDVGVAVRGHSVDSAAARTGASCFFPGRSKGRGVPG